MGKRLLLITEGFYNYDFAIQDALSKEGYSVELFQANLELSYFEKIVYKNCLQEYIEKKKYKQQSCLFGKGLFEYVLVIGGHSISVEVLKELRQRQNKAKFIFYLWDNIARVKNYTSLKEYFDQIITFDRADAEAYALPFRPLFYLDEYKYDKQEKQYEMSFFGWLHSGRAEIVHRIVREYFDNKQVFVYLVTGYYTWLKYKVMDLLGRNQGISRYVRVKKLGTEEVAKILLGSRCTIDINHETQKGLTMRTIESLAAETKILTTNEDVKYYDFYNEKNVQIIDRNHPIVEEGFLEADWEPVPQDVIEKYSLQTWVRDILSNEITNNFTKQEVTK